MPNERPYEIVAQFWHPNDAAPYLSALANEGIEAELLDDHFSMLRTGLEFMSGGTKVIVAHEDAARAREVLGDDAPERGTLTEAPDFSAADLTRSRIGRECPACGSRVLASPQGPALAGTVVLALMTAAFATNLPGPGWVPALAAAVLVPFYYRILYRLMPQWQCKTCHVRWEMPRN